MIEIELLRKELIFFNLLRQLLLKEPDINLLRQFAKINLADNSDEGCIGLELIAKSINKNKDRLSQWQEELATEFSSLFLGPAEPYAVPFASFYLSENHSLMTNETLNVRKQYLEAGMEVKDLNKIPDDHIAIEFEFVYFLTNEIITLRENGSAAEALKLWRIRQKFLQDHMALWVPALADNISQLGRQDFYKGLALIMKEVIEPYYQNISS